MGMERSIVVKKEDMVLLNPQILAKSPINPKEG
jgi:hypothetical protein